MLSRVFRSDILTILAAGWMAAAGSQANAAAPPVTAVAFSPDGKAVVAGSQAGLFVHGWPKLKRQRRLDSKLAQIHDVAFAPDGKRLLVVGGSPSEAGVAELFAWPSGKRLKRIPGHSDVIYAAAWQDDSSRLATVSLDGTVKVFDAATGTVVVEMKGHSRGVKAVGYLAGGKTLVTSGIDQSLRSWSMPGGKPLRTLSNHTRAVNDLAVRPATEGLPMVVTVSDDRSVRLWQPTIGRMVRFKRLKNTAALAVCWTPGGDRIVTVGTDGRLRVIDPDSVEVRFTTPAIEGWAYCVAVHPRIAAAVVGGSQGALRRVDFPRRERKEIGPE